MASQVEGSETQGLLLPRLKETFETELPAVANGASARHALQASHFLSAWSQRGWEFTVGLIMLELHPTSLVLVATWGLLDAALSVIGGAAVGRYVDGQPRLVAASHMYLLQHGMLSASASAALALLWSGVRKGMLFWTGLVTVISAGAFSTLGALGSTLSVEREWTKALCGTDSTALAALNAAMKRIDLICLIASPILVGLVMQHGGSQPMAAASFILLVWNLASWPLEVLLLRFAQRSSIALATEKHQRPEPVADASSDINSSPASNPLRQHVQGWAVYARQPVVLAALALALLYLTVMSWGALMTAYIKELGLPEAELAIYRGLGAVSGILATILFPRLHRVLGLMAIGSISVWLQLACLLGAVLPSMAAKFGAAIGTKTRLYTLVWGLVLSRFGLWSFDLAVNQLIQESVELSALGTVSGVQGSMQSLFQMIAYCWAVVLPAPTNFVWLMAGSCGVVLLAAILFTTFALRMRCGIGLSKQEVEVDEVGPTIL